MPAKLVWVASIRYLPLFSNLSILPIFSVCEGGAVEVMVNKILIRVDVLGGSCPSNKGNCPWRQLSHRSNGPRGVVVLVGGNQRGSCPSG